MIFIHSFLQMIVKILPISLKSITVSFAIQRIIYKFVILLIFVTICLLRKYKYIFIHKFIKNGKKH